MTTNLQLKFATCLGKNMIILLRGSFAIFFVIMALLGSITTVIADESTGVINNKKRVSISPLLQNWSFESDSNSIDFSEISTVFNIYLPLSQNFSLGLRGGQANIRFGDENTFSNLQLEELNGFSDLQLTGTYYLENIGTVLSLKMNLPSGKKNWDMQSQVNTSAIISNAIYRLQLPQFGEGFNLAPGLTWARQVADNIALGLGVSYQYKAAYQALAWIEEFDPGDEILLTGGMDVRINSSTTLSGDVVYSIFGEDVINGDKVLAAGNRIVSTLLLEKYFKFHRFNLMMAYRTQAKSEVTSFALGDNLKANEVNLVPNNLQVYSSFRTQFSNAFSVMLSAEGRFYLSIEDAAVPQVTDALPIPLASGNVFMLAVSPVFSLGESVQMPFHIQYARGNFTGDIKLNGIELGLGLALAF